MIGLENVIRGNTRDYIWEFKNGSVLLGGTGERPDNARGNSLSGAVFDELAFYHNSQDCLDIVDYALRKGDGKKVITTTPSQHALLLLKKIINDPDTVTTKGSSWENLQNIEGTVLSSLKKTDGTQLANMEIYADLVSLEGKLFKQDWIGRANNPDCQTIVVSWDPAISSDRNYNGIIVMGKSGDEGYVLADRSIRGSAEEVSKAVVKAYHDFKANYIIIEKNNGGDWLPFAIRVVDKNIPIKTVTATRGKHLRAEPVSQMYEKGMFKHCGYFRDLEEQMISYDPATKINSSQSPDRLDALVWAATFLFNEDCADNIGALQNIDGFDLSENWM
jgi:phage terminase large subunit-like protein